MVMASSGEEELGLSMYNNLQGPTTSRLEESVALRCQSRKE